MNPQKEMSKNAIYLIVFLFTLHLTPATYIESSFLRQFVSDDKIGLIFSFAAILTIIAFYLVNRFLKRFGSYKIFFYIVAIELITFVILALASHPILIISAFVVGFMLRSIAFFILDIFLESLSKNNTTGETRGYYLTSINIAFFLGPMISSFVLNDHEYHKIFTLSAFLGIPVLFFVIKYLKDFKDPVYSKSNFFRQFVKIRDNKDVYYTILSDFLLKFFYVWMIIYTPIYLTIEKNFTLSETTLIISLGLLPFLILQGILGKIADQKLGEKEILIFGFLIMSLTTMSFSFVTSSSLILWAIIIFATRIGAAMVESMTETHLFKRIDATNLDTISTFRIARPLAYLVASIIGSILLTMINLNYVFLILGVIMLIGIHFAIQIKDTR
jgi:MFS family permease